MTKTTLEKKKIIFNENIHFLDGPNSRGSEFLFTIKASLQFIKGFRALHFVGPCITVFGSARTKPSEEPYQAAVEFGKKIAEMGFTTMTGGGPGIMEAANKGAFENNGKSIGCSIILPKEQAVNPYLHKYVNFKYFFVRKVLLVKYSYAFIIMQGGFGTLDEMFETLTLIQTGIVHGFPVVLFGKSYYHNLWQQIHQMAQAGSINQNDIKLIKYTDSIEEAMEHIHHFIDENYIIKHKRKKWWILGE